MESSYFILEGNTKTITQYVFCTEEKAISIAKEYAAINKNGDYMIAEMIGRCVRSIDFRKLGGL